MNVQLSAAIVALALFTFSPARAGDLIAEVRVGASDVLGSGDSRDRGLVGTAELYIAPLHSSKDGLAKVLLEPRIQIGVSGGTAATDQAYAGLNWHLPVTDRFFVEAGAGGTVHNGDLDSGSGPLLGCRLLFREHAALGVRLSDDVNLTATIDHSSHAGLCDGPNDGLTHAGLAIGFKF